MEQFSLPLKSFDVELLPAGSRDPLAVQFHTSVADFFQRQFLALGANGQVTVTSDAIHVTWVQSGFDAVEAAIEKLHRGQLREGIQLLELVRTRRPNDPDVLYNLGVACSEQGEPSKALTILRQLIEISPNHSQGHVALGVALGRLGDASGAEKVLRTAVETDPSDPWARKNLGGILLRQGRSAEAREHLNLALGLAPQDAQGWYLMGELNRMAGEIESARAAYRQVIQLDSESELGQRAKQALNRMTSDNLPRNSEGVNPEALAAMNSAVRRLRSLSAQDAKALTLKAALIGQKGLRLTDSAQVYQIEGIAEPLSGLEVACLIHAGVQFASPGAETGLPLQPEFDRACSQS